MPDLDPPPSSEQPDPGSPTPSKPDAPLPQVITAVFWSFLGIRKGNAMRRDLVTIKPHQVIIVGLLFGALFVATLLLIVRLIISAAH
ncbi:MAG: DUF2970 domain-containing protein [Betaproteobacteria bacterium]|nr:DUF2970 domain-containing protein [Betaproteobacteria bacterium]MDE2003029.1 DUF2970 domain-containing protein [Betaproteobacteria bacterium]MDE2208413.1 DUF2970 domain-containing protein [Betaproteobacteria bacterium]MDE2359545.1 DUF2970 domain-containing protein [Betaproteobacteria bacterium]